MTREEEIKKIASAYAIDEVKDTCNPASKRCLLYLGFIDGAVWADSSVLHKATQVDLSSKGRLHNIWHNMKQRCYNPKATGFKYYGGRGIKVCDEWNTFILFALWAILNGYNDTLTIDRRNNDIGYCPNNCRWVEIKTLANNTSRNHVINGKTIAQHADNANINYRTLHNRVTRGGMQIGDALNCSPYNPKAVCQYDKDGNFIREYQSAKIASEFLGGIKGRNHIDDVCRGTRKSAFGYVWKYKE